MGASSSETPAPPVRALPSSQGKGSAQRAFAGLQLRGTPQPAHAPMHALPKRAPQYAAGHWGNHLFALFYEGFLSYLRTSHPNSY